MTPLKINAVNLGSSRGGSSRVVNQIEVGTPEGWYFCSYGHTIAFVPYAPCPPKRLGDPGPMGRILVRGEPGHDIVAALYPVEGEPVIDKPGKGAFHQTDLEQVLRNNRIDTLLVCGVTTEVCVHTTIREGNDRGYRCVAIADACASYFPEFHRVALAMITAQGGIFGWVSDSARVCAALTRGHRPSAGRLL